MKKVKNIFIAVIAMVSFLNVQPAMMRLSINSRNFVEESKKEGMGYFFLQGKLREDWLAKAVNVVLSGNKISIGNKRSVMGSLVTMADVLVGESLQRNPNINDEQYVSLMDDIHTQINDFVDNLINNRQSIAAPPAQSKRADMPPTDMPDKLSVALIAMFPNNVKNRAKNIILSSGLDAQTMFKNIYLLCYVDSELMKKFNSPDFHTTLLTVISQEFNLPYEEIATMAASTMNQMGSVLKRFENAVVTGDKSSFDIQQVRDLFKNTDSYKDYLSRCLVLAHKHNQHDMETVLKLALINARSAYMPVQEGDFDY